MKGMQAYIHNNKYVAILTFTTTKDAFKKYEKDFEKSAKTLCFGK